MEALREGECGIRNVNCKWESVVEIDADVAILGSGFGGSVMALVLERIGLDVVVVDRAEHPRFAIGESSTPTANMILRALADRYDLPRLRPLAAYGPWQDAYPDVTGGRKRGFSYFRHERGTPFDPAPDHANELLVAASSDPYHSDTQWLRADVDAFLAQEMRDAGIPLLERTEITDAERTDRWRLRGTRDGTPLTCTADFVVDATGAAGLMQQHGFTEPDDALQTHSRALFTHVRDLPRWRDVVADRGGRVDDHPFPCDQAAVHHVLDDGWVWELRFRDGRVSVGLVLDGLTRPLGETASPATEWRRHMEAYPTLANRFADADIADPPGRIVRTGRLQRLVQHAAGPGWALLPSAAGFIDPLHSTGIAHTLSGVERLARLFEIHDAPPPSEALAAYSQAVRQEFRFLDCLVAACYDALPSFRGWVASTMLYFAAVTTYERARADGDVPSGFLCAPDPDLRRMARHAHEQVAAWPSAALPTEEQRAGYEQFVEDAIEPYNEVGLFDPPVPRMYPHTAAPVA
jgi:FADH2 O2-dependent halogenase